MERKEYFYFSGNFCFLKFNATVVIYAEILKCT